MTRLYGKLKWFIVVALICRPYAGHSYPQYIAKGYTTCASCHYSPSGGGLANSYGHSTLQATFPDSVKVPFLEELRRKIAKHDVTGFGQDKSPEFQWDLGLDTRLMFLPVPKTVNGDDEPAFIPMLIEGGGVAAYGPVLAYGTLTPRRAGSTRTPNTVFSREHWLQYKFSDRWSVRGGRVVLPFGLRIPDHTQYTREDLGFDHWDQSYGVEADYGTVKWTINAAGFFGDFWLDPTEIQQRGGVASVTYQIPSRAAVGTSVLASASESTWRAAASLFLRLRMWKSVYGMGEVSPHYEKGKNVGSSQSGIASLLRVGWFPIESLDLYFEWGGRGIFNEYDLTKLRYMLGANWQVLPWMELAPALFLEEDAESGMHVTGFGQIHIIY